MVIPTIGRPSLRVLLDALANGSERLTCPVVVVDDRCTRADDNLAAALSGFALDLTVVRSGGGGPARARNIGWRHSRTPWVSFLDDDVVTAPHWYASLGQDLEALSPWVAASQGGVRVPLPAHRKPTDWERGTAALAHSLWITADMTYRRSALAAVGGFDERFPRAFREDADLGLRISESQGEIVYGTRWVTHPVRPVDDWVSLRQQQGNADDFLMRAVHGAGWRKRASVPTGRRNTHVALTAAAVTAVVAMALGRRNLAGPAGAFSASGVAAFAWDRIAPGPRDAAELRRVLLTSTAIPFAAAWHSLVGAWQHRHAGPWRGLPELVLFDRDGTLVHNVPYNGDPALVAPCDGAKEALDQLRSLGIRVGVITNQSGIASGELTAPQVEAVNRRVEELLGPFDLWRYCPHSPRHGCDCRKPAPGMLKDACAELNVSPSRCLMVGDVGSDVQAAEAAGARAVLVPTPATRRAEVDAAAQVAPTLTAMVADVLGGRW